MIKLSQLSPGIRQLLNALIIIASVILCSLLLYLRFPGTDLFGVGPHWLLIWVVAWSVKRTPLQGAIAGLALGWVQDGLTSTVPTHAISLAIVGYLTAQFKKERYTQEDFISIALIVFGMAIVAETVTAIQYSLLFFGKQDVGEIWFDYQRIALSSAI
ncbi:MAG: rod shape-determining protein MreD, partial [Chroococcales cyanobacterium]